MSQFAFLQREWPEIFAAAAQAEAAAHPDPRTACFHARRALELAVKWAFRADKALKTPYQDNLSALIHEPSFKQAAGEAVFAKARIVVTLGNRAVHEARAIPASDSLAALRELFHVAFWFARSYGRVARPAPGLAFDPTRLPREAALPRQTLEQLRKLQEEIAARDAQLAAAAADREALDAELARLRDEVAAAKKAASAEPDTHDYSEAETRAYLIDLLLKEVGWPLDQTRDREFEVAGMPNGEGRGFVDYVLWGDDGKPLGIVEAKRTTHDPRVGQQQAKLYADCLERQFGQRPVIFTSNGYSHWLWDDTSQPPRQVQGFYRKAELELMVQRRTIRRPLGEATIDRKIVARFYQERAIRRVAEAFERERERKALLVMATGAGKTRTVIALADLLMRCNWVKRVLFLADRVALVNQAVKAFKLHLPDAAPVNLVTDKDTEGRVFVSTYPTMMGLIDETRDGQRRFGVGHFDLIVIDEAHRSVFQKYRAIFQYFDALLVGLTATPKDEIDRNTYSLFELEAGVPTDAYGLEEAVRDGFLVPPKAISVPLRFQREGIRYDDLSEEEKDQWDALEWDEDGDVPDRVDPAAMNQWLFNKDTVDKVLAHVMTRGLAVAGGDRLGKTIVFAKNQAHAEFIEERFNANYPHLAGHFARVITFKTNYAQSLIDDFSEKDKPPHIAISVDMLDTGIDVPEVVNLVFFKAVRSKTKFWQMLGRGTRLCPDLFGPGQDKRFFFLFDFCQNLEFFSQNLPAEDGALPASLGKRLFKTRLAVIAALDEKIGPGVGERPASWEGDPRTEPELRAAVAATLHGEVAAMNLDNFVVRPKRQTVEKYRGIEAWDRLTPEAREELVDEVAGLPSELEPEREEAKRFDLLLLNLQLALLLADRRFDKLRDQVKAIAAKLEESAAIPLVREQLPLIQDVQGEPWWQDVTLPMLETLRRRLRGLVHLINKASRKPVYSDFEDALGGEAEIALPTFASADSFERFRTKARAFMRANQDHVAIHKLRMNRPLTAADLAELERMLSECGGDPMKIEQARAESNGLGRFIRSLVGLDRDAAKAAIDGFIGGRTPSANQIEFVNLIIDHLTEHGAMSVAALYEAPFTGVTPSGPEALFSAAEIEALLAALKRIDATAAA